MISHTSYISNLVSFAYIIWVFIDRHNVAISQSFSKVLSTYINKYYKCIIHVEPKDFADKYGYSN